MQNSFERITAIMGKGIDDHVWQELALDLGEEPQILSSSARASTYLFSGSGIAFIFSEREKYFVSAILSFESAMVIEGRVQLYAGDLPMGITLSDTRAQVETKLNAKPVSSTLIRGRSEAGPKDLWETYEISPIRLTFIFSGVTNRISTASVDHDAFKL